MIDPKPPKGWKEIKALYGDPTLYVRDDGSLDERRFGDEHLGIIPLPVPLPLSWQMGTKATRFRCNRALVPVFSSVFRTFTHEDLWPLVTDTGGCFIFRPKRTDSSQLSMHSFGAAWDLCVNATQGGKLLPPAVLQVLEAHGFSYGGRWRNPDTHHVQYGEEWK